MRQALLKKVIPERKTFQRGDSLKRLWQFTTSVLLTIAAFAGCTANAHGQQTGHYLQGITGLENGSGMPPGIYVTYAPYLELLRSLKNQNGNTTFNADLNVVIHNTIVQATLPVKFLGAWYGVDFILPTANTRLQANTITPSYQSAGISDIYVAPVVLGWTKGRFNYLADYGFYAPTGSFNPASPFSPGLGFWEQQLQFGTTYTIDNKKLWNTSVLSTWELNQTKQGVDLKPGPMATFEYSLGRKLLHDSATVGIAGYAYQQLSADSGSAVNPAVRGNLGRAFAVGPEVKYASLKHRVAFDARYEPQFAVQSHTSGSTVVFTVSYLGFFRPREH
jgi:hypothetical protein